jgi:hypothetical protein
MGIRATAAICLLALLLPALAAPVCAQAQDDDEFHLGGAIRFNYGWRDYGADKGFSDPDLELLRVDARGARGPLIFSLQYRWYENFDAVHHAWAGLRFEGDSDLRLGVQQVPFGLLPYASQSFWFGSGYYLGIEDDYDLGAVYRRASDGDSLHLGLFAGDEYGDPARFARYSFDVARTPSLPYREQERAHLRLARQRDFHGGSGELGLSAFAGRVENVESGQRFDHRGAAAHAQYTRGQWTLQAQWAWYRYAVPEQRIALSAFEFPFEIAARAHVPSLNIVYRLPRSGWFDSIDCYNNFSATLVNGPGLDDSVQNVSGCSFGKGKAFAYVDWIAGRSMWFVGGPGVGISEAGGARWRSRLNINLGFYF